MKSKEEILAKWRKWYEENQMETGVNHEAMIHNAMDEYAAQFINMQLCFNCSGTGKVLDTDCVTCKGIGKLIVLPVQPTTGT